MKTKLLISAIVLLSPLFPQLSNCLGQGTAFTYQGRLSDGGAAATGIYDLRFTIYDSGTNGSIVAGPLTNSATAVSNGLFTVGLDFGAGVFDGSARWLEIAARTNGVSPFTVLNPRQPVTSTPYAIQSANAAVAAVAGSANSVAAPNITGALSLSQLPSSLVTNGAAGVNLSGTFSGNGAGVTNLLLSSLGGPYETNVVIAGWGWDGYGQTSIPLGLNNVKAVAAGGYHSLALKSDGTVAAWGYGGFGETNILPDLTNAIAVAAGGYHNLALRNDGTVVAWGDNNNGQTNVPPGLTNVIAVAAGQAHSLALKNNGTVAAWGYNVEGETNVPAGLSNVVAVAAGGYHNLALKNDGTVVAWGYGGFGATNVPPGLTNVVAVAAGAFHSLALKSDGTVVAWGNNNNGQTNVPPGLSNVVAIVAGYFHSIALKNDGTVAAWGDNADGETNVPSSVNNVVALATGPTAFHALVIRKPATDEFSGDVQVMGTLSASAGQLTSLQVGGVLASGGAPGAFGSSNNGYAFNGNGGDDDSGMFSLGNGQIEFFNDNAEAMRIQGTWVGIGTTNPNAPLEVMGNNPYPQLTVAAAPSAPYGAFLSIDASSTTNGKDYLIFSTGNSAGEGQGSLIFQNHSDGVYPLTLASNGYVGIDTFAPTAPLQVNATGNALVIGGNSNTGGYTALVGGLSAQKNGYAYLESVKASGIAWGDLVINPYGGNVGIGTASPQSRLQVVGNIQLGAGGTNYAASGQENLRIIRGTVGASGNIVAGVGFSVSHSPNTGAYGIIFTTPFSTIPTVTATAVDVLARAGGSINTNSVTIGTMNFNGAALDDSFHFIAIGEP